MKKNFYLIFQCRVNPSKIKVCPTDNYWVMNEEKDIRPYGIILVESDKTIHDKRNVFIWEKYKAKI